MLSTWACVYVYVPLKRSYSFILLQTKCGVLSCKNLVMIYEKAILILFSYEYFLLLYLCLS